MQFACMKNGDITTLSIVAILALSLLAVGVITALTIAEEADARKKSSTNTKQSITQSCSGSETVTCENTATDNEGGGSFSISCVNSKCTRN